MKTTFLVAVVLLLSVGTASAAVAQKPAVSHNTWTSGAPMPRALLAPAAAVLGGRIFVVGGAVDWNVTGTTNTLIYNPALNTWSRGVSLPTPIMGAVAAVVNNVLYVFGGEEKSVFTNAVWAFDPQTKTWSSKSPMPTAEGPGAVVVKNNIIYVIGGWNGTRVGNVQSYDPATDTWTEEAPLLTGQSNLVGGLIAGWIVIADGYADVGDTGDIEGLNPLTNAWQRGTPDPTPRDWACGGSIGTQLYVASGYPGGSALTLTESFNGANNTWTTLADIPQGTLGSGYAVYKGKLYCFGGADAWEGTLLNYVQIYQP